VVAIDAMGGDYAPDVVLQGAITAAKKHGIAVQLYGPQDELERRLGAISSDWATLPITVVHCSEFIDMGEEPVQAVRTKKDSSLVRAVEAVQKGDASVVLSAGNSGAVMAAALFLLGRNPGVDRPALVGILPTLRGKMVLLDLGANADCKPEYLYQFAHLGAQCAKDFLGIDNPRVGLLSNGEEPGKGSILTKEAFALLKDSELNFIGNVEPQHVLAGKMDVLTCDGFSGNILLKTYEATRKLGGNTAPAPAKTGALLLGVQQPTIILHGNAKADDVEQAIMFAHKIEEKIDVRRYSLK